MIDWAQAFYVLAGTCATLLAARFLLVERRVDKQDEVCGKLTSMMAVMEALVEKHDTRLDAIDLSIIHIREFAHDTRGLLPSAFERAEVDRRRNETAENFKQLFRMLDEMKEERYQFRQQIMAILDKKQDKPR